MTCIVAFPLVPVWRSWEACYVAVSVPPVYSSPSGLSRIADTSVLCPALLTDLYRFVVTRAVLTDFVLLCLVARMIFSFVLVRNSDT